ncbi:hypothetical protein GCM10027590_02640 [Nocardiopsis nanhaiensis]
MYFTQKRKNGRIARGGAALALVTAAVFGGALLSAPAQAATPASGTAQNQIFCPYEVSAAEAYLVAQMEPTAPLVRVMPRGETFWGTPIDGWVSVGSEGYVSQSPLTRTGDCRNP